MSISTLDEKALNEIRSVVARLRRESADTFNPLHLANLMEEAAEALADCLNEMAYLCAFATAAQEHVQIERRYIEERKRIAKEMEHLW